MKEYMKPSIEELEVELEQMIADSVGIVNDDAGVENGYYKDSRLEIFDEE